MTRLLLLQFMLAAALLATACGTLPPERSTPLDEARAAHASARNDPRVAQLAPEELSRADNAMALAEKSWRDWDPPERIDNLAYLARQQSLIAVEAARVRANQRVIEEASAERERLEREVRARDAARTAQAQADVARRDASAALAQADAARQQADAARQQAASEAERARMLQAQINDMQAKATDRGLVLTIGDVLFDSGHAELKPGGVHILQKAADFLTQHPQRTVMIEGFTDAVGGESYNVFLSERRAETVRETLVGMGVANERIVSHAYGKAYPVASNNNPAGRQLNRRVEVVISDDSGRIPPRS
jgi:outer membrane protein OmpA-like peptidoglycan-associated protein